MEQKIWEVVDIKEQLRAQDCSLRNTAGQKYCSLRYLVYYVLLTMELYHEVDVLKVNEYILSHVILAAVP